MDQVWKSDTTTVRLGFSFLPEVGDEDVQGGAMAACQTRTHQSAATFLGVSSPR